VSSVRFATVNDLYETFPTAIEDVGTPPAEEPSLAFLQTLVEEQQWYPAISFSTYLLARREAVWWGCQSLRGLRPPRTAAEAAALEAAEAWVYEPGEELRRVALTLGTKSHAGTAATWMALAAGWSGGNIVAPELAPVPAPPHLTARAVRTGLMIAMAQIPSEDAAALLKPCIKNCIELVTGAH
jgi:hypothetical protein